MIIELILAAGLSGKAVFTEQKCTVCHSIAGEGNKKGPLDGIGSRKTPAEIRQWILDPETMAAKEGKTRKPPMKPHPMSDPELDALVAYLSSLKK